MNIFEQQLLSGRIYARTKLRKNRLEWAKEGIRAMLNATDRVYVALSWGKQSICLAHLVYQYAPDTPMFFLASDESWDLHNFREVMDSFTARWPINHTVVQTHRLYAAESWKAARDAGDQDLQNMCDRSEWDGWFWGLAREESHVRRKTLAKHCEIHPSIYRYKDGKLRCCPLMHWLIDDLAAYIWEHDMPLLDIYREYGLEMRTTARLTKKTVIYGGGMIRLANLRGVRKVTQAGPDIPIE